MSALMARKRNKILNILWVSSEQVAKSIKINT